MILTENTRIVGGAMRFAAPGIDTDLSRRLEALVEDLECLREQTKLTAGLAVLDDLDMVYVARLFGNARREDDERGLALGRTRLPAYCTAAGKVLLAALPEQERLRRVQRIAFERHGGVAAGTRELFLAELEEVAQDEMGINDEESGVSIQAIAAGVKDGCGRVVAAVNLVGTGWEVSIRELLLGDLVDRLRESAERMQGRLSSPCR